MTEQEKDELIQRAKRLAEQQGVRRSDNRIRVWQHDDLRIFWTPDVPDLRLQTLHGPHDWYSVMTLNYAGGIRRIHNEELGMTFLKRIRELMLLDDLADV